MKPKSIDLIAFGGVGGQPYALRGILEMFNYWVNFHGIGRTRHLVDLLSGKEGSSPHILLNCHGIEDGIPLEPCDTYLDYPSEDEPWTEALTPERLSTFINLPGRVVVCMGCSTGREEFGKAFLDGGCEAYIAPEDDPEGTSDVFFVTRLYYELEIRNCSLREAFERTHDHDEQTRMFRYFGRED